MVFAIADLAPTRAGIDREDGDLVVYLGLCPDETVERIVVDSWDTDLLWTVEGRGSTQERWVVGGPLPPGYRLVAASTDLSGSRGIVDVEVQTTDDWTWWYTSAGQAELDTPGMVVDDTRVSGAEFADAAREAYPCDDPYHLVRRVVVGAITVAVYLVLVGVTFVLLRPWRRVALR